MFMRRQSRKVDRGERQSKSSKNDAQFKRYRVAARYVVTERGNENRELCEMARGRETRKQHRTDGTKMNVGPY
jgi:hypothetical protein